MGFFTSWFGLQGTPVLILDGKLFNLFIDILRNGPTPVQVVFQQQVAGLTFNQCFPPLKWSFPLYVPQINDLKSERREDFIIFLLIVYTLTRT